MLLNIRRSRQNSQTTSSIVLNHTAEGCLLRSATILRQPERSGIGKTRLDRSEKRRRLVELLVIQVCIAFEGDGRHRLGAPHVDRSADVVARLPTSA